MAKQIMQILNPAPPWVAPRSKYVVLWHGCTDSDRVSIERDGIVLDRCRVNTDFGRGFYTTSRKMQAQHWAFLRSQDRSNLTKQSRPVVLRFQINRFDLARLHSLHFVRGDYDDEDFWSLVQHCRQSKKDSHIRDHGGPINGWYDIVYGPVAAIWKQRALMANTDQVGFHTPEAIGLLTKLIRNGSKDTNAYSHSEVTQ